MDTPRMQLIEPVPIDDDYISGIAMIEEVGPLARIVYYVDSTCYEAGSPVRVVKRKMLIARAAMEASHELVAEYMARPARRPPSRPPSRPRQRYVRLVR